MWWQMCTHRHGVKPIWLPISDPSCRSQWTVQPSSRNTAVKKGLPARMLSAVLHNNLASTSRKPTHTPAGSKFGVSSSSHSRASRVRVWGGMECSAATEAGAILTNKIGSFIQKTLTYSNVKSFSTCFSDMSVVKWWTIQTKTNMFTEGWTQSKQVESITSKDKNTIQMNQTQNMDEFRGTPQLIELELGLGLGNIRNLIVFNSE